MSKISEIIRAYVNDPFVSDHYGEWGILRIDQRMKIRELCDTCDNFEKDNEKLMQLNASLCEEGGKLLRERKTIREKAIKEFAERLKALKIKPEFPWDDFFVTEDAIDNLVKEMTEVKECTDCKHFVGCECFDGQPCDLFERNESTKNAEEKEI